MTAEQPAARGLELPVDVAAVTVLDVSVNGVSLLSGTLADLAQMARMVPDGVVLPFTYCDPYDPEEPEAKRGPRRASLIISEEY